jgi:N-acetylneuraminate synthase
MNHTIIIAEAGVNHNGDMQLAKRLVEVAADAGADYVKFQTFVTENLVSPEAKKANYQSENTGEGGSQFDMLKKLELSKEDHLELIAHCKKHAIKFLSTAFDLDSIDMLNGLGIEVFKIPSGEITNYPYLVKIASMKKPVILSTGMSGMEEIEGALKVLTENGVLISSITVLHCNSQYPTPMEDVNLRAMHGIQKKFNVKVGYSDHTMGIEVPVAAVALGAVVIEKHITTDRNLPGPDHKASIEPEELKTMVRYIRQIERALGSDEKKITVSEGANIVPARKSIHLAKDVKAGEVLRDEHLVTKRPGNGISPMKWKSIVGRKAKTNLVKNSMLKLTDLQ